MLDDAELLDVLLAGDADRCLDYFAALDPKERRKAAPWLRKKQREFEKGEFRETEPGVSSWHTDYTNEQQRCMHVALLSSCTAAELRKLANAFILARAVDVFERIRPDFLEEAAEIVISVSPFNFSIAWELVQRGLSRRPTHENYPLGLLTRSYRPYTRDKEITLAEHVLLTPSLLEHEIWALFEVEGGGENSLAAHDKYSHGSNTWSTALLELMRGGHLDRQRLIDATMAALTRDYAPFRAGWFSRFLTALELNDDERAARAVELCALLGSAVPATVALALAELSRLEKTKPVSAAELVPALSRVVLSRHKSTCKRALTLLRAVAERDDKAKPEVARTAVLALSHETPDVQKAALDLLDRVGDPADEELRQRISDAGIGLAATLQPRLERWGATAETPVVVEPLRAERVSPLDASRAIKPLASLDELIFAHAHVLEDDSDPMDVERVLAGMTRFGAERPDDFEARVSPLVKRAKKLADRYWDRPIVHCLACLALAWTAEPGEALKTFVHHADIKGPRDQKEPDFGTMLVERCQRIARWLDEAPGVELLSAPTHVGGFIDPLVLVERVQATPEPGSFDFVIALLRLAREGRGEALVKAKPLRGKAADALRAALGAHLGAELRKLSWQVTARKSGKYTFHDLTVKADPKPQKKRRMDDPVELLYQTQTYGKVAGFTRSLVRWSFTVWPTGTEAYFFDALSTLAGNIDWSGAEWENVAYYELLREPTTHIGPLARTALAIGLGAKEPGESGVSTDAAIEAIAQERVDGRALGEVMAQLRDTGIIKLKRWSLTLGVVARVSPSHADHVITAILRTLRGDPKAAPRDEGALVGLLCELLAENKARIADAEAWSYLVQSRHKRKVAPFGPE